MTREGVCPAEEISEIDKLEQEWKKCAVVDYGKDEWRTSEMLKAYERSIDCMREVAYKIFDRYYTHYNKATKEHFDIYVNVVTDISFDIIQRSDFAVGIRMAEVYVLQAAGSSHVLVKNLVGDYIKEIRDECAEAYDFAHESNN